MIYGLKILNHNFDCQVYCWIRTSSKFRTISNNSNRNCLIYLVHFVQFKFRIAPFSRWNAHVKPAARHRTAVCAPASTAIEFVYKKHASLKRLLIRRQISPVVLNRLQ